MYLARQPKLEVSTTKSNIFSPRVLSPLAIALINSSSSVANALIEVGVELQGEITWNGEVAWDIRWISSTIAGNLHMAGAYRMASTIRLLLQKVYK